MRKKKLLILLFLLFAAAALSWGIDQASAQVVVPPGAAGFNPNVNYNVPNFAYSPNIRKFVNGLPGIGAAGCTTSVPAGTGTCNENNLGQYIPLAQPDTRTFPDTDYYVIGATQYSRKLHSDLPATTLRGYRQENATDPKIQNVNQYLGPLVIAKSYDPTKPPGVNGNGKPVRLLFKNELPTGAAGNLFLPVDTTVMGAGPGPVPGVNFTQNRAAIHLHGGATPWISDGTAQQWITPAGEALVAGQPLYQKGASFANVPDMVTGSSYPGPGNPSAPVFPAQTCIGGASCFAPSGTDGKATLYYTNQQSGRLMFYHDHAYGITRLNVYAGLAAGYLLTDQVEEDMISGTNVSGAFTAGQKVLPDLGGVYHYGIPLVIQDKTFVNDGTTPPGAGFAATGGVATSPTATVDPRWYTTGANGVWAAGTTPPAGGSLWLPQEYMPNEDIYDPSGANPLGRWDYGPWLNPPAVPLNANLPTPTITPEAFMDTMLVNGTAYPYVTLPPTAVRLRILNACNDRSVNLSLFVADPANPTEVKMVPAAPNPAAPTWPADGRNGGVPDPTTVGPSWYQIGNEGGLLPQVAVIAPQPVVFEQSRLLPTVLGIANKSLFIMPAVRADVVVDLSAYAGKTLILYNDSPAAAPLFDERYDIYTNDPDMRSTGGAPTTMAGFGPNTRTIMQIRVSANGAEPFNLAALQAALPKAYGATQAKPIVPQKAYNLAFGTFPTDTYVNNTDSTVNLLGTAQAVSQVITTLGGSGYTTSPTVNFIPANGEVIAPANRATAVAGLNGVTAITVTLGATSAATPYTLPPTVAIAAPAGCVINGTTCVQATAVANISGGLVTAITVTDPGAGYTTECTAATNPAVTITTAVGDPTGAGATAAAGLTCGAVAHIQVTSGGAGYTKAPLVFFTGGGGTGATADARLTNDTVIGMKNITEGFDINYGRMNVLLGTTPVPLDPTAPAPAVPGIAQFIDPPSDIWNDGKVYVFRLAHLGVDNHAVHFHLANLQVVNRVDSTNTMLPPDPNELGWKETVRTEPFTDLILAVKPKSQVLPFTIPRSVRLLDVTTLAGSTANYIQPAPVPGTPTPAAISNVVTDFGWEYVWHCHLLGHEENDMMRPIVFNPLLMGAPTGNPAPNTTFGKPFWYTNGGGNPNPKEPVVFTVGAISPPTGSNRYRFTLNNGTTSTVVQNYSATTTWTMTGYPAGSYTLTVDAATAPSTTPDVTGELSFDIVNPPATGVTLTPNVTSPHVNGTAITFTAAGTGSTGYQYRFHLDGVVVQDYSTTATFTLPLSTPAGNHIIIADVRTNPLSTTQDSSASSGPYVVLEGRDFSTVADGKPDILWQNQATGSLGVWFMNGTTQTGSSYLTPSTMSDLNWKIVGIGDFNNDGKPDILWENQATGSLGVWFMNGSTQTGSSYLTPSTMSDLNWKIVGVGDFNGAGKPDILWQNQATGALGVWFMNGTTQTGSSYLTPSTVSDTNWKIVGVGDFNGTGNPDIVWQHQTTGQIGVWFMNGTSQTGSSYFTPGTVSDTNWKIVGR
ncbi:MAG: FG-GAP-like repeat-containing protein [Syntrophales bacterium]